MAISALLKLKNAAAVSEMVKSWSVHKNVQVSAG